MARAGAARARRSTGERYTHTHCIGTHRAPPHTRTAAPAPHPLAARPAASPRALVPPNIRRLISHWFLFPRRIAVDSIGHIAKSCMLEKATLRRCFDFCEGAYDFLLAENIPVEHRARVRLNGWRGVKGLL